MTKITSKNWKEIFYEKWEKGKFLNTHKLLKAIFGKDTIDDTKLISYFSQVLQAQAKDLAGEERKFLKRVKLELDVCVCECGEKWSETDLADLVNERLKRQEVLKRGEKWAK